MSEGEEALKLTLVRRNLWLLSVLLQMFIASVIRFVVVIYTRFDFSIIFNFFLMVFMGRALVRVWTQNFWPRDSKEVVDVDERGIWVNARLILPANRINSGFVVPRSEERIVVQLGRNWYSPAVEIRVENEDAGREVLRRLNLDSSQKFVSFILPSPIYAYEGLRWCLNIAGLALITATINFILFMSLLWIVSIKLFIAWAIGYFLLIQLTRVQLSIGTDGLRLRYLHKARLLRYRDIKSIATFKLKARWIPDWAGVQIELESGESIRLPVAAKGNSGAARLGLVFNRLQEAFADHKQGKPVVSPEARLVRGERSLEAWVRDLRRAGAGAAANHRIAPIPIETLLEVAEDPQADPIMRANAAIALGANTENGEFRNRLRIAAQATAAPRLRIALEQAATVDDEAALTEALAEVEAEAHKEKAKP